MATNTTNISLVKPAGTDDVSINDINGNSDKIDAAFGRNHIFITKTSLSALPYTHSDSKITAKHRVENMVLSNPSAQTADWSYSSTAGSITISGSITGTTDVYLYLAEYY